MKRSAGNCGKSLILVNLTLNLGLGLLRAVVSLASFVFILWGISGPLTIPLGGLGELVIPGYMVWAALLYAVGGTILTMRVDGPLVGLNSNQQRCWNSAACPTFATTWMNRATGPRPSRPGNSSGSPLPGYSL